MTSSLLWFRVPSLAVVPLAFGVILATPQAQAQGDAPGATKAPAKNPKKPAADKGAQAAREAFKAGESKLQTGDAAGALSDFQKANETLPSPAARYKIAVCFDKLGKTTEAADAYRAFLAEPPPEDMGDQSKEAEARVLALTTATLKVITTVPAEAVVTVDGSAESTRTPATLRLKPGKHAIEVTAAGYEPAVREVDVIAGGSGELSLQLSLVPPTVAVAPPPPPPAAPPPPPPPSKVPAYVTLGLSGAGVVVGSIFGVRALSARSDFNSNPTTSSADRAEQSALIADMAFGVAITLGITGAVLLLTKGDQTPTNPADPAKSSRASHAPARSSLRLTPLVTPHTQGAAATFRFLFR